MPKWIKMRLNIQLSKLKEVQQSMMLCERRHLLGDNELINEYYSMNRIGEKLRCDYFIRK